MSYTYIDGIPNTITVEKSDLQFYQRWGKRLADIFSVLLIAPFVFPVVVIAWATMFVTGGAGFYCQPRVGRQGKEYKCWKIRTMARNADKSLAAYIKSDPKVAHEWSKNQKLRNDPRITSFGNFLRKTSIDELPQLWNVLIGDMSLIGPRPFTPNQKVLYDGTYCDRAYYHLRPGISGLWQVEARNTGVFVDRIKYDESYASKMSFSYDLKIGLRTISVVLKATGI